MRLVLRSSVFSQENSIALSGLLHRAMVKRFYLDVEDLRNDKYEKWIAGQSNYFRSAWQTLIDWSSKDVASFKIKTVIVDELQRTDWSSATPISNLQDAIDMIDVPFLILLENGRNDSNFLLAMCSKEQRSLINRLVETRRVMFHGGGGIGELRKIIQEQIAIIPFKKVRHWAMFDSDAAVPGVISSEAQLTKAACILADIGHHVLERRAIENYLPKGALYDWASGGRGAAGRREFVNAFYELDGSQRSHFHMKSGPANPLTADEQTLYAGVDPNIWRALQSGFGSKIAELYGTMDIDRLHSFVEKEGVNSELRQPLDELTQFLRVPHG